MSFDDLKYVPILKLRPSEMVAAEELPSSLKRKLTPFIPLKRWLSAHNFKSVEARLSRTFGEKEIIVGIDYDVFERENYLSPDSLQICQKLKELTDKTDEFENWYNFIDSHKNYIPSPILISDDDQSGQIQKLVDLGRGLVIRIDTRKEKGYKPQYLAALRNCKDIANLLIIIDLGTVNRDALTLEVQISELINKMAEQFRGAKFAVAASSFPNSFVRIDEIGEQEIYEIGLFQGVERLITETNIPLIYSDYASARPIPIGGGGGNPIPPRIDIMQNQRWRFFRPADRSFTTAAVDAFNALKNKQSWGAKLIENTATSQIDNIIESQAMASKVRINIHLYDRLMHCYSDKKAVTDRTELEEDF